MRTFRTIVVSLVALWLLFVATIYYMMRQPPERFGRFVNQLPGPAFMLFPFETLWLSARGGTLSVGDQAPDFRLRTLDKTAEVSLSSFRGSKPVVLIFGSYT